MFSTMFKIGGYLTSLLYAPFLRHFQLIRVHGRLRLMKRNGIIEIGRRTTIWPGVRLSSLSSKGGKRACLTIGTCCSIGDRTEIHCCDGATIGSYVLISWDCNIIENNFHTTTDGSVKSSPITIGDRVWIGCRAIVLSGVTIGEGSVIGAGSVVTRDVPPGTLAAGNPARVIRQIGPWQMG